MEIIARRRPRRGRHLSRVTHIRKGSFMESKTEKTKEEKISAELRKFKGFCRNLSKDRKNIAVKLCQKAAFMEVTLEDLQDQINKEGAIVEAVNGNGFKVKSENPAQKTYNTMIKNYTAAIKQLTGFLPESAEVPELDEFQKLTGLK